jgi:uridine kinase
VILDGLFPQRRELAGQFDLVVYLDVPFEVAAERLRARDGARSLDRYVGASLLYFAECDPLRRADLVIDNR